MTARRLERLAMIFDDIDAEALIAIPDTTAPDAWWILAETKADGLHREAVERDILRAVLRTIPTVRTRVQLMESGRLPRDPGGGLDRREARRLWRDHRRWVQPQDIEAKPETPWTASHGTGPADIDGELPGEGDASDERHPTIATLLLRAVLQARFADRPALASIGDDERLVASGRLTPSELIALVDEVGGRLGLRATLVSPWAIDGATITSLTRQFGVAEAIPDVAEADSDADVDSDPDPDSDAERATEVPPAASHGPDHRSRTIATRPAGRPEDLVAGRIDGPFSDPILGAGGTPVPGTSGPDADPSVESDADADARLADDAAPASTDPVRSPGLAARPAGGGGRRRATRRLRRAGAIIRPGLVACSPIGVQIDKGGRVELGRNVTIMPGVHLHVGPGALLLVHDGVRLGPDVRIVVEAGRVELGADVRLDAAVEILARGDVRVGAAVIVGVGGCITTETSARGVGPASGSTSESISGPRTAARLEGSASRSVIVAAGTVIAAGDIVGPADSFRSVA